MDKHYNFNRARELFKQGKYDEAVTLYESILNQINDYEALNDYGICLVMLKKYEKAIAVFLDIISKQQDFGEVWYSLGRTYLILDDTEKAMGYLEKAKEIMPPSADVYYYSGLCYEKIGETQKAIDDYQKSLNFNNCFETHINIGLCYFDKGDLDSALKHTRLAYELNPENLDCLCYYAYILIKSNRKKDAFDLLIKSTLNYDEHVTILEMLTMLSLDMGDFSTADKTYNKLKNIDNSNDTVRDYKMLRERAEKLYFATS